MRAGLWSAIGTTERWLLRPHRGVGVWLLRVVLALLAAFVIFRQAGGVDVPTKTVLDPSAIKTYVADDPGHCYRYALPFTVGDIRGHRKSTMRLYEDGVELGPAHALHSEIVELGGGRYSHWGDWNGALFFSTSDGSDPRTSGKTYEAHYMARPKPLWVVLVVGLTFFAWAYPLRMLLLRLETRPLWVFAGLFLLTLGLRAYWGFDTGYVDYVRVRQLPFSDAQGWMELSEDFARGARVNMSWPIWDARRPLTYVINGSWMALVGISTFSIVIFNVLCSALSAILIFDALRRLAPFPVALACALLHSCSLMDAAYGTTTLSEPSGYFLSNVAIWLLARAVVGERRGEAPVGLYFLAGLTIAVANMSRPLTLLSAPAIPLLVLLLLSRRGLTKRRVVSGAVRAGVFVALGAGICIGPWVVRQHFKHGITTLSDNTAEMLYSASDPKYGAWTPQASMEATNAGHSTFASRNDYFNARFKENIREHPGHYAKVIFTCVSSALAGQMAAPRWWLVGLFLLALWGSGAKRVRGEFLLYSGAALAVALAMALALPPPRVWLFFLIGSVLALLGRDVLSLFVVSLGFTLFSIGLVAAPYFRFTYSLHWLALAIELWAVWQLARVARHAGIPPDLEELRAAGLQPPLAQERSTTTWVSRALLLLAATLGVGLTIALTRHLDPEVPPPLPELQNKKAWKAAALSRPEAADYAPVTSGLVVRRFLIRGRYLAALAGGEDVSHASGMFVLRDYDRSYFQTNPPVNVPPGQPIIASHTTFPALLNLEGEVPVTAVGYWVAYGPEVWAGYRSSLFEIVAYTEDADPQEATWVWGAPKDRRAHAEVLAERARAGAVFTDSRE